ncbi:Aste57867_14680 [Aphanomyces stellatus]|uniref:Aste57867_14680 protein n=1 Tax=Aphanomyces stellatus TaxID=120398 RepID=A0A485L1B0_9STRA|nr:hypothetical protein As57867_014625 [Aphanomyces stellatus]VFT91498.1 Aste57867_14680 [Aphanomyces stellatus]
MHPLDEMGGTFGALAFLPLLLGNDDGTQPLNSNMHAAALVVVCGILASYPVVVVANVFQADRRVDAPLPPWSVGAVGKLTLHDGSFCTATRVDLNIAVTTAACVLDTNGSVKAAAVHLPLPYSSHDTISMTQDVVALIPQRDFFPQLATSAYVLLQLAPTLSSSAPPTSGWLGLIGDPACPSSLLQPPPRSTTSSLAVACVQFAAPHHASAMVGQALCQLNISNSLAATHSCDTSVGGSIGAPLVTANNCLVALHLAGIGETTATGDRVVTGLRPETANVALVMDSLRAHIQFVVQHTTAPPTTPPTTRTNGSAPSSSVIAYACIGIVLAVLVAMAALMLRKRMGQTKQVATPAGLSTPPRPLTAT